MTAPDGAGRRGRVEGPGGMGKVLIVVGVLVAALGVLLVLGDKLPWLRLGRLPGDIAVERGNFRFYFPIVTSIVLSVVVSLVLWLLSRRG
ncbi:MAG TPA: DUF2905 domain-containing protein [Anaeromyxobacter sp.]|nr:DUF2905 domain-containing protein [Anaeromyxobacter sp.]